MKRNELNDVSIFVAVARANGFRAAADNLKLGAGSVSEAVQRFEDRLGVRLIERSTRAIALTKAGNALYRRSLPAILELEQALSDVSALEDGLTGTLRLTAPIGAGQLFLDQIVAGFARKHPALTVDVIYDEKKVDLVASGVDAAIRAETLLDLDTHAIAVGPTQDMMIVASETYLSGAPPLQTPSDVAAHAGICFAFDRSNTLAPWIFTGQDGGLTVMPTPRMVVNDVRSLVSFAEAGLGLAYVYAHSVSRQLGDGKLVQVLAGSVATLPRFSLNYLSKRNMPARVRAFIDFAKRYQ